MYLSFFGLNEKPFAITPYWRWRCKPPVTLKAGDVLFIPRGTIHSAKNVGSVSTAELAHYREAIMTLRATGQVLGALSVCATITVCTLYVTKSTAQSANEAVQAG